MNGIAAFVSSPRATTEPRNEGAATRSKGPGRGRRRTAAAWQIFAGAGAVAIIVYFLLPDMGQALLYAFTGIAAGVTIIVATRRDAGGRVPWLLFAGTQLLWAGGDLIWSGYEFVLHQPAPYPSVADWLYLAGYPLSLVGIVLHVRRQAQGPRRYLVMDAAVIATIVGLTAWQGFIRPYITEAGLLGSGDLVGLAYPVMDLALLAFSAALLVGWGGRSVSNRLMVLAIGATFFADVMYSAGGWDGTYHQGIWYDAGWLIAYTIWGVAALHPSARSTTKILETSGIPRAHLNAFLLATFVYMGVLIADVQRGVPIALLPLVVGGGSVFALVILRMQGLTTELHNRLVRARESEEALRQSEERFRTAFESSSAGVILTSLTGKFLQVNRTFAEMVGRPAEELVGQRCEVLTHPEDRAATARELTKLAAGEQDEVHLEKRLVHRDGRTVWVSVSLGLIRNEAQAPTSIVAHVVDQSRTKELEESLRWSQKMDAVGQLAGGVAHDFNNLLSVIQNYTRFVHDELPPSDPNRDDLGEVLKAGERGANLVRQLLTFSRREKTSPQVLDINVLIADISNLLRRSLRESVELRFDLTSLAPHVEIDPAQLEQVLLNLALNARDAMPTGGELVVRTDVVEIGSKAQTLGLSAGHYVLLSVTDNGSGMSDAVRVRAFEPFFTTKERGAGTGLGLSTVYGSVARAGGTVVIESAIGQGTTFEIYLPHIAAKDVPREDNMPATRPSDGTETILVVEDEVGIRRIVQRVLERNGYEVIVAESSPQAIGLAQDFPGRIDLLLTDVVMPQLSGVEVAERIRLFRPDTRVLFMSGYTDDVMAEHGLASAVEDYLPKPFTAEDLLVRVRSTLDDLVERT